MEKQGRSLFSKQVRQSTDLADGFLIWLLGMITVLSFIFFFYPEFTSAEAYPTELLAIEIAFLIVPLVIFPLWYLKRKDGWEAKDFGLTLSVKAKPVWIGAIGLGIVWSLLSIGPAAPVAFLLLSIIQPSFIEEFAARGVIQTKLQSALGEWKGLVFAGLLFGLWHLPGGLLGINYEGPYSITAVIIVIVFVFQALIGMLLGFIYFRTKSLVPGIVLHYLLDFGGLTLALLL